MAKMFYTLEEAAERLNTDEDGVKRLSEEGKLQQFRDRDKLMFKREQVDNVAGNAEADAEQTVVDDNLDDSNIHLAEDTDSDASKTDAIDLTEDTGEGTAFPPRDEKSDSATATGVSVFDADEIEQADPMDQTQVTESSAIGREDEEEDLSLDTAGSGSGLLDLTRESDDTSLGAVELLEDEGTQSGGSAMGQSSAPASSTGIFESAGGAESAPPAYEEEEAGEPVVGGAYAARSTADAAGDGFAGGVLAAVFLVLVVAVIIVGNAMQGVTGQLTEMISTQWLYAVIGLAVGCIVFGLIGWAIGRSRG